MGFKVYGCKNDYVLFKNKIIGIKGYTRTFERTGTELKLYESWLGNGKDFLREIHKTDGLVYTKYVTHDKFYKDIHLGIKREYPGPDGIVSERFEKASAEEITKAAESFKERTKGLSEQVRKLIREDFTKKGIWKRD